MTDQGRSYSLITVEKADAVGDDGSSVASADAWQSAHATRCDFTSVEDALSASASDGPGQGHDTYTGKKTMDSSFTAHSSDDHSESALDGISEEDLKGSVPMEQMHRIIIALVVVGLVAFAIYLGIFA